MSMHSSGYSGYDSRVHYQIAEREGYHLASGSEKPRTLHIGNLDPSVTDKFLGTLFNQIATVTKVKVFADGISDPFAFVEFTDHTQASQALQLMNGRQLLERKMHVKWAVAPSLHQAENRPKTDTSRHFHVFVGDLCSEVDSAKLREAFIPFGEISDTKIIIDNNTNKAKGYGFVSFPRREDAERAIEQMNGQWLGRRTIRTNWATRKPGNEGDCDRYHNYSKSFDEICQQTSADNTSVYVGNINALGEEDIRRAFDRFGAINDVRIFKLQGYAFVKFMKKESAARAIMQMNNSMICGQPVRCSWGKSGDANKQSEGGGPNYGYGHAAGCAGGIGPLSYFNNSQPPAVQPGKESSDDNSGGANSQYWQYYAQYYNNQQLMQQWNNYWQGGKQGPPPPPSNGRA